MVLIAPELVGASARVQHTQHPGHRPRPRPMPPRLPTSDGLTPSGSENGLVAGSLQRFSLAASSPGSSTCPPPQARAHRLRGRAAGRGTPPASRRRP